MFFLGSNLHQDYKMTEANKSIGQSMKDTFMSISHGAAGPVDHTSGGNPRTHPASDAEDITNMRDHGSGKNGPGADFRKTGEAFSQVRKDGDHPTPRASAHGVDGNEQFNA